MSIIFYSLGGTSSSGGGSTSAATENAQGIAQIATSNQVTQGTETGAFFVTPARLQDKISTALVGALEYKGSYNNVATPNHDLTAAKKGDFYIIGNAGGGTLAGVSISQGDHIVFNQDSANPLQSSYFDVIVSADAVQSVNGRTGVVTGLLDASNNLSDLANATTARTNLSLGSCAVENVGTGANEVVQLDGSSKLPAVDGSQLTNLPTPSGVLTVANNLSDLNNATTARTNLGLAIGTDVQAYDADLTAIAGLSPTDNNFIVGNGSAWVLENATTARTSLGAMSDSASIGDLSDVTITTAQNNDVLKWDGSAWVNGTVSSGGISSVVEDTNPDLGGHLDVNGKNIVSTSDGDINILPHGTGKINLDGDGSADGVTVSDGLVELRSGNASSAQIEFYDNSNTNKVTVKAADSAALQSDVNFQLPSSEGASGQFLQTDGSGNTSWASAGGSGALPPEVKLIEVADINNGAFTVSLTPSNSSTYSDLEVIYKVDNSTTAAVANLPTASSIEGKKVHIKMLGTANITVTPAGSEYIDHSGQTSFVLSTQYSNLTIVSDNANWLII